MAWNHTASLSRLSANDGPEIATSSTIYRQAFKYVLIGNMDLFFAGGSAVLFDAAKISGCSFSICPFISLGLPIYAAVRARC
jgi:hypothetical protein